MALGIFQRTVADNAGDVQASASVEVRIQETNSLASIYSDRAGTTPLANPFTTGSDGLVKFFAEGNAYKITATKGAFSVTWEYVAIGTAAELDIGAIEELIAEAGGTPELAEIATQRLLANISGSPAAPVENTLTAILDNIVSTTQGAILYRSGSAWVALAPGTSGLLLKTLGAGANPAWGFAPPPWRTVETKSSASGSSVFFNSIPQDATDLRLLFDGVSNVTTTQPLQIELSTNNGSSYGTPVIITSNQVNTTALHGYFEIRDFTRANSVKIGGGVLFQGVSLATNQSGFGYNMSNGLINAVNALRLTWGSGNFDAGSITLQVM
jgi:hypothetical protein